MGANRPEPEVVILRLSQEPPGRAILGSSVPLRDASRGTSSQEINYRYCRVCFPCPHRRETGPNINRRIGGDPVKLTPKRRVMQPHSTIERTKYFRCTPRVEGVARGVFLVCRYITIKAPLFGYYGLC